MAENSIYILGISAYYHDSAAALLKDGVILAAAQEERFSRQKHDSSFPAKALAYVLKEAGITLPQVSAVAFYEKPLLKFERLLETYHALAPQSCLSFMTSMPVWIKEKLFMRSMLEKSLKNFLPPGKSAILPPFCFPEHHLSHAASAFYPSPFDQAAILTVDGVGEWATTSIAHGQGNKITCLREIHFPHSLGLLYSAFTAYCGFKVNSGEYKLMGLAPYGHGKGAAVFERKIRDELIDIRADGSYVLNMRYFNYATGLRMYNLKAWQRLFSVPPRPPESAEIDPAYMDMALAIQKVTEDVVLRLSQSAAELSGSANLCLAGGVALNCVANGKILRSGRFRHIWIQPAAGDAGGALGAALACRHIAGEAPRIPESGDAMRGTYLGPDFSNEEIIITCRRAGAVYRLISDEDSLCRTAADLLNDGQVLGWFQGRMEYGPRALGGRSILGDARNPEMQKRLNLKIKMREGFRPFAPSVLEEDRDFYFELEGEYSPYMLLTAPVAAAVRQPYPEDYEQWNMWQRLYFPRSSIPAVTHVDYSARIQTVNRQINPRYWKLLQTFKELHGCSLIVNTSFNLRGEPIVCTPEDAYRCFMRTEMDYLIMGDCLLAKADQPPWREDENWRSQYVLD
ncbi:MAG: carbamoyltransferase [Desulfarculales bacterium]|jgi:carbamoyltransferase|nr:carbamoyltransferase [Desulfarculales bacterium]